jgi:hypothetical protein
MKKIAIILFLSISFVGLSQTNSTKKENRFAIGFNYSVDRTFRVLKLSDGLNSQSVKDSRDAREEPSINYTTGLGFSYSFTKRLNAEIGVLYAQTGYQTKESNLSFSNIQDPRRGFSVDVSNLPLTENLIVKQNYLNIPIKIRAFLIGKKVKFFLEGGLSTNIYLKRRLTYNWTLTNGEKQSTSVDGDGGNISKINVALVLGLGIDYYIKDNYILKLNPVYRKSINQIADWVNKEYIYSFGLNLGVYYQF